MRTNKLHISIQAVLIIIMIAVGIYAYPLLPETVAIHRNITGHADGRGSKEQLLILLPSIVLGTLLMMKLLPYFDPKKAQYKLFANAYQALQSTLVGFFVYLFVVSIYVNLYNTSSMTTFVMIGLGVLFILIGTTMSTIKQNYFVGLKTPRTLSNEEVWNKSHQFMKKTRIIGGTLLIINTFAQITITPITIAIILSMVLVPVVYSYWIYKQKE